MRTRFLFSLLGLGFGSSILIISLFSATQVSSTGGQAASESKLYFSHQVLPDHSLYKVIMAMDRLQLETATPQEQIFIKIEYAHRRLDYAKALLQKENEELAMTTLLKSQNYLNQATQDALASDVDASMKERIAKAIAYHSKELVELAPQLTDAHRAQLDQILKEHDLLMSELRASIAQK
ncbi:hypothetical protein H3C66_00705 [Patescibacteria group bacterium]|nr:hypothetical protein [Patescibacteria group bacterium]